MIIVTSLTFRGRALVVCDPDGHDKYFGRGRKNGDIEWTAVLPDCESVTTI